MLDKLAFIFILINFYLTGLRTSINTFKSKAGIFVNDKYVPLLESFINLAMSIILVKYLGLAGIFIGTTISTISIPIWTQSKLVYNKVFNKSVIEYFKTYIFYVVLTLGVGMITTITCNSCITEVGFIPLVLKGIICIIMVNSIYIIVFHNSSEFKYLWNIFKPIIFKLKSKIILEKDI